MSLQTKVLNVLRTGKNFSAVAIANQLRTTEGSVVARISELRSQGYAIYSNPTDEGRTAYRLGSPSRRMVAAAFALQGSAVFN
jgi:biotin operon repressor